MKKTAAFIAVGVLTAGLVMASVQGEELFKKNCVLCHADGSTIGNPEKTLHKASLEANGIKTENDIISRMRHPGPGMLTFDEKSIPPAEARAIAEYILATFR